PKSSCAGAASDAGIRAVMNRGLAGEADDPDTLAKFQTAVNEINAFADNPLVTFMFGPHAPYSCMASLLKKLTDEAEKYGIGLNIHLSESKDEMAMIAEQHDGMTPIEYVDSLGIFRVPTLAAHCVQATDHDIEIFKEKGVSVALNPKSNMKLGNGFAPAARFLEAGVNVALGTDGCGSNNSLNMFQEMNTAALVYKGANCSAQCVSAEDVLTMATEGGAKAIGMEGKLGVIAEGALADIIILNLDEPQFQPLNNIVSGLVYSSKGSEVETVIVDGRPVMENGHILSVNVAEVYAHCDEITKRLNMQK
ncbi:MAG: amidohydrolase family protein, partial [Parasporobacterium sp.]|nr:amidohydrolase family protein [Parasporobacterium sp.]